MACLVYWYIFGTFGCTAFVSFGDSTLNSCRPDVMYWSAEGARGQIKYTKDLVGF